MSKVRPMIDKDLRDEIVNYCGEGGSFNVALRYFVKSKSLDEYFAKVGRSKARAGEREIHNLHGQVKQRDRQIIELKQEIEMLHNEKVKLKKWSSEVSHHNASLMGEISGGIWRAIEGARLSLYRGVAIGLIVGLSFGYLFL